jgi:Glycosyl hydrolases family 16
MLAYLNRPVRCSLLIRAVGLALVASTVDSASAQVLLRDDFAGAGIVAPTVWRLPFGTEGTFVGRTQFRGNSATDMPLQGIAEPLATDGKVAEIKLDTFSSIDPGNQFLGTDLLTKRNFARGGGLSIEARLRLKPSTSAGLVNGFFLFDVQRDEPAGSGTFVRDEIDWELLGNQAVGAATNDPLTNYWNEGSFTGPDSGGAPQFHNVAGLDLTKFQNYKVEWTPGSIRWLVNGAVVRTQTTDVPDDPMKLHLNLWAPDSGFSSAFSAALQPTANQGSNQTFAAQVDHVEVRRFNTNTSSNLLVDGSFEEETPIQITGANGGTTGAWLKFGNVFIESSGMAPDGFLMAKMFGPFNGSADASGLLQNVPAQPGQEFEARVSAFTPSFDSILGNQNFNTIALSFLDASGNVLREEFATPGNFRDRNGRDFPLLDGRDPNLVEDELVEGVVNAVAPAGTALARLSLFFVQLNSEGGSSWFDNASLVRLSPNFISGDMNGDGSLDNEDINPFVLALVDPDAYSAAFPLINANQVGDFTGDVALDNEDIQGFVGALIGSPAAVPEPTGLVLGSLAIVGFVGLSRRYRARAA